MWASNWCVRAVRYGLTGWKPVPHDSAGTGPGRYVGRAGARAATSAARGRGPLHPDRRTLNPEPSLRPLRSWRLCGYRRPRALVGKPPVAPGVLAVQSPENGTVPDGSEAARPVARMPGPLRAAGPQPMAAGHQLRAADVPLRAPDHPIMAADPPLRAADRPVRAADRPLMAADHPLRAADRPLKAADYPLRAADRPLRAGSRTERAATEGLPDVAGSGQRDGLGGEGGGIQASRPPGRHCTGRGGERLRAV